MWCHLLFPQVMASPPTHHLCLHQHAPDLSSYAFPSNQVWSITYKCGTPSGTKQTNKRHSSVSHLLWMPSTLHVEQWFQVHEEILRPVGCRKVWWGEFVLLNLLLLCRTYTNNKRNGKNPRKWVAEQMWYRRGYPELGRPCKLITGTCQLRGKQGKACKLNQLASWGCKSCKLSSIYDKFVVDKFISLLIPAFLTYLLSANPLLHLPQKH